MRHARVGRGAFPPSARLDVMAMATRKPARYHCSATRWSLDDLVAALAQGRTWTMSRSSIWRLLDEADLKPHRSVYWLNSHDPDFEAKAHDICSLYLNALRFFEQDRVVIISIPIGASRSAVWSPSGARCPLWRRTCAEVCSGALS